MVSFDTNILVYATVAGAEAKTKRARDLIARGMRAGWSILLLQTLAEFSSVAIREAGIPVDEIRTTIDAGERCCPCKQSRIAILAVALDAVKMHRLGFGMRCCGLRRSVLRAPLAHRRLTGRICVAGRQIRQPLQASKRSIGRRNLPPR